jgi:hypothetical protein
MKLKFQICFLYIPNFSILPHLFFPRKKNYIWHAASFYKLTFHTAFYYLISGTGQPVLAIKTTIPEFF